MKDRTTLRRKMLIAYLLILLLGVSFWLSGYSFSFDFFDYLIAAIIVFYPVISMFQAIKRRWVKILIGLGMGIFVGFLASDLVFWTAFSDRKLRTKQTWHIKNYHVVLGKWQGFAGGPYNRFDLKRSAFCGILEKYLGYGFSDTTVCLVDFKEDGINGQIIYLFDTCSGDIQKTK